MIPSDKPTDIITDQENDLEQKGNAMTKLKLNVNIHMNGEQMTAECSKAIQAWLAVSKNNRYPTYVLLSPNKDKKPPKYTHAGIAVLVDGLVLKFEEWSFGSKVWTRCSAFPKEYLEKHPAAFKVTADQTVDTIGRILDVYNGSKDYGEKYNCVAFVLEAIDLAWIPEEAQQGLALIIEKRMYPALSPPVPVAKRLTLAEISKLVHS